MSDCALRRMKDGDLDAICAIEKDTFAMPWSRRSFEQELHDNKCARYLIAETGGEVLGYAGAWLIFEEGHITNVAVKKSARGQGVGRLLTAGLMQYAANLGVQYMTLEVRQSNLVAQNLYKSLGFKKVSVRKKYYEDNGEDALLMVTDRLPPIQPDFREEETVEA